MANYSIRDAKGVERGRVATLSAAKGRLGAGWTVWFLEPVYRTVDEQMLVKGDKTSRAKGSVNGARVGGQHSSLLVHRVDTGKVIEHRVF